MQSFVSKTCRRAALALSCWAGAAGMALAQPMPMHPGSMRADSPATASAARDGRVPVAFPPALKREVLATMRMHLRGLAQIQQAMAQGRYDEAARFASMTLGMASMHGEQARREARYMPPGMRALGQRLHMQAGRFALAAQDATATGDTRKPQQLFGQMMQTCVACHASYRLK